MRRIITLLIALSSPLLLFGQSPGGVTPAAWYRADATSSLFSDAGITNSANNTTVYQWNDAQGNGFNLLQTNAGLRPTFSNTTTLANFNPTVTFQSKWMEFQPGAGINIIDRVNGTLYAAGYMNNFTSGGIFGFDSSMDYPGLHTSNNGLNNLLFFTGGPGYQGLTTNSFSSNYYFTAGANWQNGGGATAAYASSTVSLNGVRSNYAGTQLQNAVLDVNARDIRVGGDTNWGSINGQVNEMLIFENALTADEMDRVESYLAIKYGTTYAQGTRDYKNSSSATVWGTTVNAGYNNNIAGIARDVTGLNQKQSWSTNPGKQILIGTTGLANTNAANATSLTNGQYLVWGDNGLQKTPNVSISGIPGINYRFASIWKAQNTGSVGTIRVAWPAGLTNLRLIQSSDAAFDNSDTVTNMAANTQTVNGVTYNYADVTLENGQYFTLAAFVQAPGGVVGDLRVWLKPDNGFTPSVWQDKSINANDFTQTNTARQPFVATTLYNFNPVVDFGGAASSDGRFMAFPSGGPFTTNGLSATYFTTTLTRTGGTSGYRDIWGFDGTTTTASLTNANSPAVTKLNDDIVLYNTITSAFPGLYPDNKFLLTDMSYTVNVAGIKYGLNGTIANTTQTRTTANSLQANGSILGSQPEVMNGVMGDMIAYERDLTPAEKIKVRTYTSVKYGITLPHDYVSSSDQVVWDNAVNAAYNKNIFGIANDFVSALEQKQSVSINDGQKLVIGAGGALANTNALNTNTLTNGQFLIVGDNGLKQSPVVPISGITGVNYRFESIWKAQNTGDVGTVRIAWPAGLSELRLVQSSDAVFDGTDTATNMSINTQIVNGVTYNYADVTLANGQYFTLAAFVHAPGGVLSSLWYRADKGLTPATGGVATWTDYSAGQVPVSPGLANTTSTPTAVDGTGLNLNFNPGITFASANALGNSGNLNLLSGANHTIFTSTTPVTGNGYDRIFGLNYTGFSGGLRYDSPGLAAVNIGMRNSAGTTVLGAAVATGYRYNQLTNTTIVRNTFTNTLFTRSLNGAVAGANDTYSNITTGANGGILFGRNANDGGDDDGVAMTMAETIVFDGVLSANDINRVDSYLAIKGGITLDIANTPNYLSSNSTNVWNSATNTGYNNNIFGIANDFLSALHQKQSKSINNNQKLIIGAGGTLANTNGLNTNSLIDGQFLMVGDNGLKQNLSVPISGIAGVNYRFASIWKAQNTGNVGTVRIAWPAGLKALRLIQSPDAVFDSNDTVTDMSVNTQTVNGVTYNYADVTIGNGQFFTFAAFANAPGGVVNGLSQWYRADIDAVNTGNGSDVTSWTDYFAGTVSTQKGANALPKYRIGAADYFNFNPGLNFTAGTQTIGNNVVRTLTSLDFDVFTLTKEGMAAGGGNPRYFSVAQDNSGNSNNAIMDAFGLSPTGTVERRPIGGGTQFPGVNPAFSTTIPSIMYHKLTNTTAAKGLNGGALGTAETYAAQGEQFGGHYFGDTQFGSNGSDNRGFIGNIGETIVYGAGTLSDAERRKVDTYLAIKYGITLGRIATDNYVSSADAAIWNGALNTAYNNNVFGLAKDDISSLHQKVSKSVNAGTILSMATNNDFVSQNTTASRTALSGDQKYFLAGDNLVTATPLVSFVIGANPAQRIQRIWLSQRTNTLGNIYFSADLSAYGTGFAAGNNIRMFVADDAAFTVNVQSVAGVFSGGKWVFNKSFDTDATARYITFGSEAQPQVLWVKADKGVNTASGVPADNTQISTWYDQEIVNGAQNGTIPTVDPGESAETAATLPTLPFYRYNATDNFNFNPVVNFSNLNRGNAVQFTTPTLGNQTVISVFKAAGFGTQYYENMLLYGGDVSTPSAGDPAPERADMSFGVSAGSFMSFGGGSSGDYSYLGNLGLQTQPAIGTMLRNRVGDEEVYYSTYGNGSNDILNQNADPDNTRTGEGRLLSGLVRMGKHFSAPTTLNDPEGRLNGSYAELIVYDRLLSDAERAMVESYLAVKYGITLTGGTDVVGGTAGNVNYPYVNSSGAVVRASDAAYRFDVFGLGRDDHYGLNQRISKSNNAGDILTVSTNTDFNSLNLNAARTAIDGDQEYMLFANNRGSANAVVQQTTELPANVQRRLDREWKVAQANTDGTNISNVSLRFNLAGVSLTGANVNNIMLLIDSDGDGDFTTGAVQAIPASSYVSGSAAFFNNINLNDGQVFTLGITEGVCYKPGAVAGVGNPALSTKTGITALNRAGATGDNWPGIRTGAWLALESKVKGFVPNRVAFSGANPVGIAPSNFVEGMMVYDTTNKCMKMYTLKDGDTALAWHCISSQACPDTAVGTPTLTPRPVNIGYWGASGFNLFSGHTAYRNQLENTANYGASGTFKGITGWNWINANSDVDATAATFSAAQLKAKYDVIVTGYNNMTAADAPAKIKAFTDLGGVVIVLEDGAQSAGNALNSAFGGTGNISNGSDAQAGANAQARTLDSTISNGVFGTGGGIVITGVQGQAVPPVTNIPPASFIAAYMNYPTTTSSDYAGVYLAGAGNRAIFVYDEGIFRAAAVSGTVIDTPQEIFIHNLMSYALQAIGFSPN